MAQTVRLATFNVENLFSRPLVMNFDDNNEGRVPLETIVKLDRIVLVWRVTRELRGE